jgi:ABC-type dipeptide/oligopeptide/nickel transport system permease component
VLTARAKGLPPGRIIRRHALRNALLPIATLVALSLGTIVGGVLIVEYVFSYPGIGLAVVEAIDKRDYPVLQGAFLLLTVAVVLANLIADLIYPKIDPRVTVS